MCVCVCVCVHEFGLIGNTKGALNVNVLTLTMG